MLFLILHIAGNAIFVLLVKVARAGRFDYAVVGVTNYATAATLGALSLGLAHLATLDPWAAIYGAVNGMQYQFTYLLMYALIGMVGIAVTSSFLRLSVAVQVLASVVIWREWPTPPQALGLLMAAIALPLLTTAARRSVSPAVRRAGWGASVLIGATVLISGCGLLAAKAFAELHEPDQRPVYVFVCYLVATVLSGLAWRWRPRFSGRSAIVRSVLLGALIGAINVGQIWVLLPALAQVPGVIAFPVAAAGGLALTTLGGWLFWREPLAGRTGAGITLAVLAAALANAR
jgi:drug/metabolite transporter (DMT)-like permease